MLANAKRLSPPHLQRRHALAGLVARGGLEGASAEGADGLPAASPEKAIDWSRWYLTEEEDMGQSPEQDELISVLVSSLQVLAEERGWRSVLVGRDQFFAWVEGEPLVQVSPDVFLLDDPPGPEERRPRRWETWRPGHKPPRFAVEIVSEDWKKDYEINPARYDHLGVSELVIADADAWFKNLEHRGRFPLSVYRRSAEDRLEQVYQGRGPAWSREIDAYLCFQQPAAGQVLLRVSRSADGQDIVPTALEKIHAAEDKAKAAEDKAKAAEDKAKAAEAEIAALRALVQTLQGS